MGELLRYACIGAGGIADKKHLNGYQKLSGVELTAVCDSNPAAAERLAGKYGIGKIYTDYRALLSEEHLDLVSICTPNFLHAPITLAALNSGAHVHCEKPLAINGEEAAAIVAAKNQTQRKVMLGLNYRFTNEAQFVKRYIAEGLLGEIYHVRCGWRRRNGIPGRGVWFTDRSLSGGGALIDLGVHFLDLVLFFLGYPDIATVSGETYSKFGNISSRLRPGYRNNGEGRFDVEDMAVGLLRTTDRTTVDFEFSWASNVEKETRFYELLGTKGGISFRDGELRIFTEVLDTSINLTPDIHPAASPVSEFEHFSHCIRTGAEPISTPEQGLLLARIIDSLYLSAEQHKEILL